MTFAVIRVRGSVNVNTKIKENIFGNAAKGKGLCHLGRGKTGNPGENDHS
jgi:hypothetical protein